MKKLVTVGSFGAKIAIVITATVGGTALVGSAVFASLTATAFNTSAQSVNSGVLSLTQAPSGVANLTTGFTQSVSALAPGDSVSRFVDVSNGTVFNGGTLAGASMTLGLSAAAVTRLTSDTTNGLQVIVKECPTVYAYTAGTGSNPATAACGVGETTIFTNSANVLLAAQPLPVATTDLLVGGVAHLRFIISLPNLATEVTTNGTLPTPVGGTLQGLTASLTWTFTETQRTGTSTVA